MMNPLTGSSGVNEMTPDQRVEWQAGDIVTIPSNAWHKHYNASADEPALLVGVHEDL